MRKMKRILEKKLRNYVSIQSAILAEIMFVQLFLLACPFLMSSRFAAAQATIDEEMAEGPGIVLSKASVDGGVSLRRYILERYRSGDFSATDVCTLAHCAVQAGAEGVSDLALPPSSSSGNFSKHLKRALALRAESTFYIAEVPMFDKDTQSRYLARFPMNLPHDIFAYEYARNPSSFDLNNFNMDAVPSHFFSHEVTQEFGPRVVPLGYFSDGVPFTNKDSFIAYYLSNILTGDRFFICSVRKSDICACSCSGNCTFHCVLRIIAWSLNCVAAGCHPTTDHVGDPFTCPKRIALAGQPLADGYHGALVEMRADILEFVQAVGYKQWSNVLNPCFACGSSRADLYKFPKTMCKSIWCPRDKEAYRTMVAASTTIRHIPDRRTLKILLRCMDFDEKLGGFAVVRDCTALGLDRGWRLLPEGNLYDVHKVSELVPPCDLHFFDKRNAVGLNHICALYQVRGFSCDMLALDVMHICDLGVVQFIIGEVFMRLILKNFSGSAKTRAAARHVDNLLELRRSAVVRMPNKKLHRESLNFAPYPLIGGNLLCSARFKMFANILLDWCVRPNDSTVVHLK